MEKIDEQIELTLEQANGTWEDLIIANLKYASDIYEIIKRQYSADQEFADEVIKVFCDIMNRQRDCIINLETDLEEMCFYSKDLEEVIPMGIWCMEDFKGDEDIHNAFEQYLTLEVKKPLSSYTINDYCSRIKFLWNVFCEENKEKQEEENSLLQAFRYLESLRGYLERKIEADPENRNLANAKAALNKFSEFKLFIDK